MKLPFNIQPKRTPLQQRALERAKQIFNSDPEKYQDTMFCPYCGNPLVKSGKQRHMQTLCEHVSDPNSTPSLKDEYVCSAESIMGGQYLTSGDPDEQTGCEFGILHAWNGGFEKGGSYSSDYRDKLYKLAEQNIVNYRVIHDWLREDHKHKFYDALNTDECEMQTSIYNTGLPDHYRLPAWLTFNLIQLTLDFSYNANSFGEVTDTYVSLGFLKKDNNRLGNRFCIVGIWPWKTWKYLQHEMKRNLKLAKGATNEEKKINYLARALNISMNDAWIYRFHQWYAYVRHPRYGKMLKAAGKYKTKTW